VYYSIIFKKSKALANEIIENAEAELKRCGEEKQRLIRQVQKGIFTDGEVKSTIAGLGELFPGF
jgi:hypothetical protein